MIPPAFAAEVVCLLARVAEGATEVPPSSNAGPFTERCQRVTGNRPPDPWCASFVAMVGVLACGDAWPLPKTASCQALHDFAITHGVIYTTPAVGDVFLIWHPELHRFAHTGFVIGDGNLTISGNTSGAGSREGWMVGQRVWTFTAADRFIRWTQLLPGGFP